MAGTAKICRRRDAGVEPRKEESSDPVQLFQEEDDSSPLQAVIHYKSEQEFTYPLPEDLLSKDEKQRKIDETYHQTKGLVEKRLEFMEKTHQIKYSDAPPSMSELFNTLMVSLQMNKLSSSYIMHQITANPILSRMATSKNLSVLDFACTCTNNLSLEAIKCLIAANPNALLWQSGQDNEISVDDLIITKIAEHRSFCRLMPWIATNYSWIFDHELCLNLKELPIFSLLEQSRQNNCTPSVIGKFCEAYPKSLNQDSTIGYSPLHTLLCMNCYASSEAELFDLFKSLAKLCPSVMSKRCSNGRTLLHDACTMLALVGDNLSRDICKFLLAECPHLVKVGDNRSELPIHSLLGQLYELRSQREVYRHFPSLQPDQNNNKKVLVGLLIRTADWQTVMEVCVCLFRSYPDSFDMCSPDGLVPSSIPFAQHRMKAYLNEEREELTENINQLQEIANAFNEVQNDIVSTIFNSWVSSLIEIWETKVEAISFKLEICSNEVHCTKFKEIFRSDLTPPQMTYAMITMVP